MRQSAWLSVIVAFSFFAQGSDSPREYDNSVTPNGNLCGSWKLGVVESHTELAPDFDECVLTFYTGGRVTLTRSSPISGRSDTREGNYKADGFQRPGQLDLSVFTTGGSMRKCIYVVEGDTLKIAMGSRADQRPTRFTAPRGSADDWDWLGEYQRVK